MNPVDWFLGLGFFDQASLAVAAAAVAALVLMIGALIDHFTGGPARRAIRSQQRALASAEQAEVAAQNLLNSLDRLSTKDPDA